MKLAGARVVLTGAAGGIGTPLAHALHSAGAGLLLVGRDAGKLEALRRALAAARASGAPLAVVAADLTTTHGIDAVSVAAARLDADVLINNAGQPSFGRYVDLGVAHIAQALAVNLVAPMQLTHALLPALMQREQAAVLNIGSALGRLALPGFAVYAAGKFGLRGFSEALRRELAGSAVRVQYLGPRVTATAFNSPAAERYNRATGAGSDAPELVARAAVALLRSGRAERFIGFPEAFAVRLNGAAPAALDAAFSRHRRALGTA